MTTSVKVVGSNEQKLRRRKTSNLQKKEEFPHLVLLPQYSVPLRIEISPTKSVK